MRKPRKNQAFVALKARLGGILQQCKKLLRHGRFDFFERVFLHLCIWIKPPFGYMLFAQLCIDLLCNTLGERNNLFLVCLTQT